MSLLRDCSSFESGRVCHVRLVTQTLDGCTVALFPACLFFNMACIARISSSSRATHQVSVRFLCFSLPSIGLHKYWSLRATRFFLADTLAVEAVRTV